MDGGPPPPLSTVRATSDSEAPPTPSQRTVAAAAAQPRHVHLASTHDVDEACAMMSKLYASATLEPLGRETFGCELHAVVCGPVQVVKAEWPGGGRMLASAILDRYILSSSDRNSSGGHQSGEPFSIVPGRRGAMFSPGQHGAVQADAGFQGRSVTIERGALETHFRALTGRDLPGPLVFDVALSFEDGPGIALRNIVSLFRHEVQRPGASPLWLVGLRDALFTSILANARHTASYLLDTPPPRVAQGCVRRAEEFITAHAAEPITVADIVAASGVPERSLRAAFQSSRGVSPMELLRHKRLEIARTRLTEPEPGTTVAGVVTALGLGNPGRFSADYKKRFGVTPSQTLAAGLAAVGLPLLRPRRPTP